MKFVEVVDRQFVGNVNEFIRFGGAPIQSHFCIVEDVNKLNLRSALIRKSMISNVTGGVITGHHVAHNHVIGSLNVCTSQEESPEFLRKAAGENGCYPTVASSRIEL
jgi:hypothetical protein